MQDWSIVIFGNKAPESTWSIGNIFLKVGTRHFFQLDEQLAGVDRNKLRPREHPKQMKNGVFTRIVIRTEIVFYISWEDSRFSSSSMTNVADSEREWFTFHDKNCHESGNEEGSFIWCG